MSAIAVERDPEERRNAAVVHLFDRLRDRSRYALESALTANDNQAEGTLVVKLIPGRPNEAFFVTGSAAVRIEPGT